jgi:hypothetical protein
MIPALANLSRRFQFSFKAIYNVEKLGRWKGAPKSIDVRHVQWTSDSYLNHLASGDIGVLPNFVPTSHATSFQLLSKLRELFFRSPRLNLNRMDYNLRFKHNSNPGRLYDFARAGLPVVAEPSISIGQALQHGVDGFLALTQEGWEFHLEMLLLDGNLRNQMGKNLQRRFQTYSDGRLASQAFIQEVRRFLPGL